MFRSPRGFTLIEILLVMAILVALGSIAIAPFIGSRTAIESEEEINHVRSLLRSAQGKAIALEDNSQWGVRFSNPAGNPATYELFAGAAYPGTVKEKVYLSPRFKFTSPASGLNQAVIFLKRSGKSSSGGSITITIQPNGAGTPVRSVVVTSEGTIQ